jgi:hypothetical protein
MISIGQVLTGPRVELQELLLGVRLVILRAPPGAPMIGPPVHGPDGRRVGQLIVQVDEGVVKALREAGVDGDLPPRRE